MCLLSSPIFCFTAFQWASGALWRVTFLHRIFALLFARCWCLIMPVRNTKAEEEDGNLLLLLRLLGSSELNLNKRRISIIKIYFYGNLISISLLYDSKRSTPARFTVLPRRSSCRHNRRRLFFLNRIRSEKKTSDRWKLVNKLEQATSSSLTWSSFTHPRLGRNSNADTSVLLLTFLTPHRILWENRRKDQARCGDSDSVSRRSSIAEPKWRF